MRPGRIVVFALAAAALAVLFPRSLLALETDQFSLRHVELADSRAVLNEQVNDTIARIVESWDSGRDEAQFRHAIYDRLGGPLTVDWLERWASEDESVDRIALDRASSIYANIPLMHRWRSGGFPSRLSPTIRVGHHRFGTDKIGHFFSQGLKYYRHYERTQDHTVSAQLSARTENGIFGRLTTGVYSNADLVANYEGYRFYASLFMDGVIPHKNRLIRWAGSRWIILRPFDWADHVSDLWDESINISFFARRLAPVVEANLQHRCQSYFISSPAPTTMADRVRALRYPHLRFIPNRRFSMSAICLRSRVSDDEASAQSVERFGGMLIR